MSTPESTAPAKARKINLRTPDVMAKVQEQVESHYRSTVVERIRANGGVLQVGDTTVLLAKQFGFCYGVERAIDLAYAGARWTVEHMPTTDLFHPPPVYPPPGREATVDALLHASPQGRAVAPNDGNDAELLGDNQLTAIQQSGGGRRHWPPEERPAGHGAEGEHHSDPGSEYEW